MARLTLSNTSSFQAEDLTHEALAGFDGWKETLKCSEEERLQTLAKLLESVQIVSIIMGVLNIDVETIISEFAAAHLLKNNDFALIFLECLIVILDSKMLNLCSSVIIIDYRLEGFIRSITFLTSFLYYNWMFQENADSRLMDALFKLIGLMEKILTCEHKHDILRNDSNNTFADLIHNETTGHQLRDNLKESPSKGQSNQVEFKLFCKNICAEMKSYMVFGFAKKLRSEDPKFKSIFKALNDIPAQQSRSILKVSAILRVFKSILIADEEIFNEFNTTLGAEYLLRELYKLYNNYQGNTEVFNTICLSLADIALTHNNCSDIKNLYSVKSFDTLPILNPKNLAYFSALQSFILKTGAQIDSGEVYEILAGLLHQSDNVKTFKENEGITFIFEMLMIISPISENVYVQLITIFERIIAKLQGEDFDLFFETFFHPEFIKKCSRPEYSNMMVDLLGVIAIHISFKTNPILVERICSHEHFYNVFGLIESENSQTIEAALKFINVIFSQNQKKALPSKTKLIPLFMELMQKTEVTISLLTTVFDLVYSVPENVQSLFPSNSSTVSTIMNRSLIADQIIKGCKDFKATKLPVISNIEFLELLFFLLGKAPDDITASVYMKQFYATLEAANIDKLFDTNFITWISAYLTKKDILSVYPTKDVAECLNIINRIFMFELQKAKTSKAVEYFKRIDDQENLVIAIVRNIINTIAENPVIKNENISFLKNLASLFQAIEDSLGLTSENPEIYIYIFHCINILASKNSGEIRSAMKNNKLFEFRDHIVMEVIRFNLKSTTLHEIIKGFTFETISGSSKFRESHIISFLLKFLIENQEFQLLQILIVKIIRDVLASNEENVKYIFKIIEHPILTSYLFPNYNKEKNSVLKCFNSAVNSEGAVDAKGKLNEDINPETSEEDFLKFFNSEKMEIVRTTIILKIKNQLIVATEEILAAQRKVEKKKTEKKLKAAEKESKDRKSIQTFIIEERIKINQKFSKNMEKFSIRNQNILENMAKVFQDKKQN